MHSRIAIFTGVAAVALPGLARADHVERGVVVSVESGEAYFDLGKSRGSRAGRPLRIKRPISLPHPVSGKTVSDELLVGSGVVTMASEQLSMVVLASDASDIAVGDVVEVLVESDRKPEARARPDRPEAPALPPVPEVDRATADALRTWRAAIGASLDVRKAAWERYLADHPKSPHAAAIRDHVEALNSMIDKTPTRLVTDEDRLEGFDHQSLTMGRAGEAIKVAVAVRDPSRMLGAWLHYRRAGDDGFERAELIRDGDGYLRGTIPGDQVGGPGVEYFVEVATTDGRSGLGLGTPQKPVSVAVAEPELEAFRERRNRSRVSVTADYLDFATFDRRADGELHRDVFVRFETDFLFRLRGRYLYGIKVGLGFINGEGGFADEPMAEGAGFNFGYTELQWRLLSDSAILTRVVAGIGEDGLGFGGEGRLRLGAEDDSNLTFGVSTLEDIGFLSDVRMQWAAIREVPLGLSVGVTDQPNNGDLGVRLGADIGYRALPWFQPTLRVSYQGRSLQHSGVGVGAGVVFDW
jgi:hypothetical protein